MHAATPDDIVSGVKQIVAREINDLNPDVQIEFTDYFNHTYNPDMILSWGSRRREHRQVFLRSALHLRPTLADVQSLKERAPVVLGLKPPDAEIAPRLRDSAIDTRRVFVTDLASIDTAAQETPDQGNPADPLLKIVRSNILRSGRGVMTAADAAALVTTTQDATATDPEVADLAFSRLESLTNEILAEDGAYQVARAGQLIRAVQSSGTITQLDLSNTGRLSETDVDLLLPYLLGRSEPVNEAIWSALAGLVNLDDLEGAHSIAGSDITSLANFAVSRWLTSRAELVYNNEYEPADIASETTWRVVSGRLTATIGPWKVVFVSDDNRRLKGASDSTEANWSDIAETARSMVVESATLRGLVRRFTIDTEQSSDVVRDIEQVTSTLNDSYRVQNLSVRLPGSDSSVDVDFRKKLATPTTGTLAVDELGTVALRLLGHRFPVTDDWMR